ncbi:hypothetical protein KY320_02990, partial [Candidatus Woesearchaeota archaeon]|nr:hypothetical protein [Candidatus Woesearchaeota archaeon]
SIVAGFAAIIFFVITYLNRSVLCDLDCLLRNQVTYALIFAALAGAFVGSLTYYLISEKYEKRLGKIQSNSKASLKFLDPDQKALITELIKAGGTTTQNNLVQSTPLSRVKVSRVLKELEAKQVVKRSKKGMTKRVELPEDLKTIFIN